MRRRAGEEGWGEGGERHACTCQCKCKCICTYVHIYISLSIERAGHIIGWLAGPYYVFSTVRCRTDSQTERESARETIVTEKAERGEEDGRGGGRGEHAPRCKTCELNDRGGLCQMAQRTSMRRQRGEISLKWSRRREPRREGHIIKRDRVQKSMGHKVS